MTEAVPALDVRGLTKSFPGVKALTDVDFTLQAGEVHALFGENGAGKSTLTSIIAGVYPPDAGEIRIGGKRHEHSTVAHTRSSGVAAVFQDLSLAPSLTVAENVFLGAERTRGGILDKRTMADETARVFADLGFTVDPGARVANLSAPRQRLVEIVKAIRTHPKVLILDEPTVALTHEETEALFTAVRALSERGTGVIYITHRMQELAAIAHRVTVLRGGRKVGTVDTATATEDELILMMTGRESGTLYPEIPHTPGREALRLTGIRTVDGALDGVDLSVHHGEIVAVAGLDGSGRTEVGMAAFGLLPLTTGHIDVDGRSVPQLSPRTMSQRGVGYCPPDRRRNALLLQRPLRENVSIAHLGRHATTLARSSEPGRVNGLLEQLDVRPRLPGRPIAQFSGGNQQKAVLARWLMAESSILILDEPTAGIDVGARAEIYRLIEQLCAQGHAVLLISSDLPEVIGLAHSVHVMAHGRVSAHLQRHELTEENLLRNFF